MRRIASLWRTLTIASLTLCLFGDSGAITAQESGMTSNRPMAIPAATPQNAEFGRFDSNATPDSNKSQNGDMTQNTRTLPNAENPLNVGPDRNVGTLSEGSGLSPRQWTSPSGIQGTLGGLLTLTLLTLVPAIILMTTSFVRISVVLAMLRQAFGMPQIPPNQVLTTLSIFLTLAIMLPVWTQTYRLAVVPYSESTISGGEAIERGTRPIRDFMIRQIDRSGNAEDIHLFLDRMPREKASQITTYEEVPISVLLPAFLLSELKTAFWIGFRVCLPFLVIDLVVAAILSAIGMIMVPPAVVAIPLKLLLFVLADGWRLLAGALLDGFL